VSHIRKSASSRPLSSSTSLVIALVLSQAASARGGPGIPSTWFLLTTSRSSVASRFFAPTLPWHQPSRLQSLGTCGVSLDRCLDFSLTAAAAGRPPSQNPPCSRSRALDQKRVRLIRLHFVPSASWGNPSREGLALPISLCGCSSIPVRGGTRIASLHQYSVVSSSTPAATFLASQLVVAQHSTHALTRRDAVSLRTASLSSRKLVVLGCQAALWHPEQQRTSHVTCAFWIWIWFLASFATRRLPCGITHTGRILPSVPE
jgi:hypothetical protein